MLAHLKYQRTLQASYVWNISGITVPGYFERHTSVRNGFLIIIKISNSKPLRPYLKRTRVNFMRPASVAIFRAPSMADSSPAFILNLSHLEENAMKYDIKIQYLKHTITDMSGFWNNYLLQCLLKNVLFNGRTTFLSNPLTLCLCLSFLRWYLSLEYDNGEKYITGTRVKWRYYTWNEFQHWCICPCHKLFAFLGFAW